MNPRPLRHSTPWPGHPSHRPSHGPPLRQPSRLVPFQKRTVTTPAPPGRLLRSMTVCIAATSHARGGVTITASDMMLSDDWSSVDSNTYKVSPLFKGGGWRCMYSGLPTDFEELRHSLRKIERPKNVIDAMTAVERAYDHLTNHYIERHVLSPFGLTHEDFMGNGREIFGETYFRELVERCTLVKPPMETTLLVTGFDSARDSHIFEAQRGTKCTVYDELGFHAIGAGGWAALGSLFTGGLRSASTLSEAVYRVCEAKFVSEIARSVGREITVVNVYFSDGTSFGPYYIDEGHVIRKSWESQRNLPAPPAAIEALDEILKD